MFYPQHAGVGLGWSGRWGAWSDHGVHVLAACVGDIEVVPDGEGQSIIHRAVHEISRSIQGELPPGASCVNIHGLGAPVGRIFRLRVALVCEPALCVQLLGPLGLGSSPARPDRILFLLFSNRNPVQHGE